MIVEKGNKSVRWISACSLISLIKAESLKFDYVLWSHNRREENRAAHCLAVTRPIFSSYFMFLDSIPSK